MRGFWSEFGKSSDAVTVSCVSQHSLIDKGATDLRISQISTRRIISWYSSSFLHLVVVGIGALSKCSQWQKQSPVTFPLFVSHVDNVTASSQTSSKTIVNTVNLPDLTFVAQRIGIQLNQFQNIYQIKYFKVLNKIIWVRCDLISWIVTQKSLLYLFPINMNIAWQQSYTIKTTLGGGTHQDIIS